MSISGKMDRNYPVNIDVLCVAGDKRLGRAENCRLFQEQTAKGRTVRYRTGSV